MMSLLPPGKYGPDSAPRIVDVVGRVRPIDKLYPDGSWNCPFCSAAVPIDRACQEYRAECSPGTHCPNPACCANPHYPVVRAIEEIARADARAKEAKEREEINAFRADYANSAPRRMSAVKIVGMLRATEMIRKVDTMPTKSKLDAFTLAYIEAMLFSSNDESNEQGGDPLDQNYSIDDIAPETLASIAADCARFQRENGASLESATCNRSGEYTKLEQAGHDFWMTRAGHGCGFWDGDWSEPEATSLTESAGTFREHHAIVGDDGHIYCE